MNVIRSCKARYDRGSKGRLRQNLTLMFSLSVAMYVLTYPSLSLSVLFVE